MVVKPTILVWDEERKGKLGSGDYLMAKEMGAPDLVEFERVLHLLLGHPERAYRCYRLKMDETDERIKELRPVVLRVVQLVLNSIGGFEDTRMGMDNLFENLGWILSTPDLSALNVSGDWGVLVSAGPSLEGSFDFLQILRARGYPIFAVDAVYRRLLKEGIFPDFVVTSERVYKTNYFLMEGVPGNLRKQGYLLGAVQAHSKLMNDWEGGKSFICRNYPYLRWFEWGRAEVSSFTSVAPTALSAMATMGVRRVILVGQDLAFDPESGATHADLDSDILIHARDVKSISQLVEEWGAYEVEGNEGGKRVWTYWRWEMFGRHLSLLKEVYGLEVVNTSYLGKKLEGIPYASFRECLERLPSRVDFKFINEGVEEGYKRGVERKLREKALSAMEFMRKWPGIEGSMREEFSSHEVMGTFIHSMVQREWVEVRGRYADEGEVIRDRIARENLQASMGQAMGCLWKWLDHHVLKGGGV